MEKIEHINYIKSPIADVYKALATQAGLGAVWTEELIVKSELGFINEFNFGDNDNTKMKVVELVQNQRVLWECVDSDPEWVGTKISFDLTEKNGVTSVVLKHFDWRELTEFYRWCNYNWAMFLLSLKSYCEEGEGTPYQKRKF
ncbi:SRPBCC domain-containing protein [Flavobacterium sp. LS1R47]|uniref:SRPBCC domain-containing protein n=1 Tax=Flavobacterium frigoritolerans TaxID=2987686 RepID=A0A9X3HNK3_9FLAO|nr:SRPBCC domain-containing protein [Flavobacterium frigoritolerans]MCV9934655.1 SRPBCC domain-containing protein [Flavobacterium frigoritolerans]